MMHVPMIQKQDLEMAPLTSRFDHSQTDKPFGSPLLDSYMGTAANSPRDEALSIPP